MKRETKGGGHRLFATANSIFAIFYVAIYHPLGAQYFVLQGIVELCF